MAIDTFHQGLLQRFAEEATEQVSEFNERLLLVGRDSAKTTLIADMASRMNALKNSAKMIGVEDVARFSHVVKGVLEEMTTGKIQPSPVVIETLLESGHKLQEYVERMANGGTTVNLTPVIRKLKHTIESYKPAERKAAPVIPFPFAELEQDLTDTQKEILLDRFNSGFNLLEATCYFHKATLINELEAVQKEIAQHGEIIGMMRSAEPPPPGFDLQFRFCLASHLTLKSFSEAVHFASLQIRRLSRDSDDYHEVDQRRVAARSDDQFVAELLGTKPLIDEKISSQRMRGIFLEDFCEKVEMMSKEILALEKEPKSKIHLNELFRICHNLKGSGGSFGYPTVSAMAHYIEAILDKVREKEKTISAEAIDVLLMGVDALREMSHDAKTGELKKEKYLDTLNRIGRFNAQWDLRSLKPTEQPLQAQVRPPQPPPEIGRKIPTQPEESIRVGIDKLDRLTNAVDQLTLNKSLDAQTLRRLEKAVYTGRQLLHEWRTLYRSLEQSLQETPGQMYELNHSLITQDLNAFSARITEVINRIVEVRNAFQRSVSSERLLIDELHSEVLKARTQPLETIFETCQRIVRDVAREHSKEAMLQTDGGSLEIDRLILDRLRDPLIHLIRNAIDHGIETPEEREGLGKPRAGIITLRAKQIGNQAVLEIEDDGQGIDPEALKTTAIAKGFLSEDEARKLRNEEVLQLIFRWGFSTSKQVTELSGRGIGMDVVSTQIKSLGGSVDLWSLKGVGTKFSLRAPLSLALTKVLLVEVNSSLYSIPVEAVESVQQFSYSQIRIVGGKRVLMLNDFILPLIELSKLLGLDTPFDLIREQQRRHILILNSNGKLLAVLVDDVVNECEVMTRGLGPLLKKVRKVAGVNVLVDGTLSLLVNVIELFEVAQRMRIKAPVRPKEEIERRANPVVLVVEESSAEREFMCGLLTLSGYRAQAAKNGYEALLYLTKCPCDLIVTDIELPILNGFELLRILRSDEQLRNVPVIIMTAKDSERDRQRCLNIGAHAYIVKGPFDQQHLLRTVKNLLGNADDRSYIL